MFHMLGVGLEREGEGAVPSFWVWWPIQLSLLTTATLGTEESGRCREVAAVERFKQESMYDLSAKKSGCRRETAVVERFKQESMYDLSAKKSGCCREMAVVERWLLVKIRL